MILDTRITLETAEGTDLPLYPCGFWIRGIAYFIDFTIRSIIIILIGLVFSRSGLGSAIVLIGYFLLEWFYPVYFEVWQDGQTIGKKVLKIRVIHDDGTPIGFSSSLTRNLLRVVDILPLFYVIGTLSSLCNKQFKRLGDLAAGSIVVYHTPRLQPPSLPEVGSLAVPQGITTDEQRHLLAFAQRIPSLSVSRQAELAGILRPLIKEQDTVTAIQKMGNHIVGKR